MIFKNKKSESINDKWRSVIGRNYNQESKGQINKKKENIYLLQELLKVNSGNSIKYWNNEQVNYLKHDELYKRVLEAMNDD